MSDASESSFVACVKLVENHAPRLIGRIEALTPAAKARALASGLIKSIAPPMADSAVTTTVKRKNNGPIGFHQPESIAAFNEVMDIGTNLKRGEIATITAKHNGNDVTVYRMVYVARQKRADAMAAEMKALANGGRTQ